MRKVLLCIVAILCGCFIFTGCDFDEATNGEESKVTYEVIGGELGEYGKEVILNKNTDMPTTKILYKIPTGTYVVTTDAEKVISVAIVKDEIANTGSENYPEELQYVTNPQNLTASDGYEKLALKEYEITINDGESLLINGEATITLTQK